MKVGQLVLVALAAAVTLTSVAAAAPEAAKKQRVAINAKILPQGTFLLTPLRAGALKRDSGTFSGNWQSAPGRDVIRNGQTVGMYTNTWNLVGKRGTLTIRERIEWVDVGNDDDVATGTWKVLRGTKEYAGITGSGGSGHAGLGQPWYARFEGFLTLP
jgi:hypothetical protein